MGYKDDVIDGRSRSTGPTRSAYMADYREKNKSELRAKMDLWRKNNPDLYRAQIERARDVARLKEFGLTREEYDRMLLEQNGKCSICDVELALAGSKNCLEKAHIDHCHRTGKIRSILCCGCNSGLGFFKDNTDTLKKAIQYLRIHDHK